MAEKKIKLTEEVKKQMLLLNPMSRTGTIKYTPLAYRSLPKEVQPWFKLRQLTNEEAEQVQVAMAQSVLDQPTIEEATGKLLVEIANQKREEYTKILSPTITDWGKRYEPVKDSDNVVVIPYDLTTISNIREDILLDIFSESCAISGIVLR